MQSIHTSIHTQHFLQRFYSHLLIVLSLKYNKLQFQSYISVIAYQPSDYSNIFKLQKLLAINIYLSYNHNLHRKICLVNVLQQNDIILGGIKIETFQNRGSNCQTDPVLQWRTFWAFEIEIDRLDVTDTSIAIWL